MLLINTKLAPSPIHGIGLFANQFVKKGDAIWQWHEGIDLKIAEEAVNALPSICRLTFLMYSWMKEPGIYRLCVDNERFINHSDDPNCIFPEDTVDLAIASRDIQIGEEITQDYRMFDKNFGSLEHGYDW